MKKIIVIAIICSLFCVNQVQAEECTEEILRSYDVYADLLEFEYVQMGDSTTFKIQVLVNPDGISIEYGKTMSGIGFFDYITYGTIKYVNVFVSDGGICAGEVITTLAMSVPDDSYTDEDEEEVEDEVEIDTDDKETTDNSDDSSSSSNNSSSSNSSSSSSSSSSNESIDEVNSSIVVEEEDTEVEEDCEEAIVEDEYAPPVLTDEVEEIEKEEESYNYYLYFLIIPVVLIIYLIYKRIKNKIKAKKGTIK